MAILTATTVLLAVCGPSATALHREGAPADLVVIENRSTDPWSIVEAQIDLGGSAGRLIFDTVPGGPGTSMSQPFRTAGGTARLAEPPVIPDGTQVLTLRFAEFPAGASFRFTIDLDDRVSGGYAGSTIQTAEIEDALLRVTFRHDDDEADAAEGHEGLFDSDAEARAAAPCVS
jgi:hypothetical protein